MLLRKSGQRVSGERAEHGRAADHSTKVNCLENSVSSAGTFHISQEECSRGTRSSRAVHEMQGSSLAQQGMTPSVSIP